MSIGSPDVVLYDVNGTVMAVQNGIAIPASTPALMIAGSDGTNSHYVLMDGYGREVVVGAGTAGSPVGGVLTVQGIASGTALTVSGTVTSNQGTANTLSNAWPVEVTDGTNVLGTTSHPLVNNVAQFGGTNISTGTGAGGAGIPRVTVSNDSNILATQSGTWTVGLSGTGSDNTTNSTSKLPVLAARANTSAPIWTDGYMVPLSATTTGLLRVDGSAVTQPVAGTGVAGTPAGGVLSIQGVSGGTKVSVVTDASATATLTSVAASVSSVSLLASNSNRILATFFNDSNSALYLAFAATASNTAYTVKLLANSYYELPLTYTGIVSGIWNAANGSVRISEMT